MHSSLFSRRFQTECQTLNPLIDTFRAVMTRTAAVYAGPKPAIKALELTVLHSVYYRALGSAIRKRVPAMIPQP